MAAAPSGSIEERLRLALQPEVSTPGGPQPEMLAFLTAILSSGGGSPPSPEAVADSWGPHLAAMGACEEEDAAAALAVTTRVLGRIYAAEGATPAAPVATAPAIMQAGAEEELSAEIVAWMEQLKLTPYLGKAKAWCNNMGAVHVSEILENVEEFILDLGLKPLEKKRVEKAKNGESPVKGVNTSAAAAPPSPAAAVSSAPTVPTTVEAKAIHGYFGPKEDPRKYAILEELGQGATATVYKCMKGNQVFAAKTISLSKLRLQPGFQRIADTLRREVSILFSLRHPRIVSLHDVIESPDGGQPDKLYLVMELVPGGDLFDKIVEKGALREQPAARYVFIQIAEGLQYIHSKDIVYRDLKPENILVDQQKSRNDFIEIKLTDFGHSKLVNDGYSTALTKVGTPQYWAPEVNDADQTRRSYTQAVDLWSLGVVLYVMVIGAYPFDGHGSSIDQQIRTAHVVFRTNALGLEVTEPARELIKSLIKVDPLQRLSLKECLNHRWVRAEGAVPTRLLKLATEGEGLEERIYLPTHPTSEQRQNILRDFNHWMSFFHGSVRLKKDESGPLRKGCSVVTAQLDQVDPEKLSKAKDDLLSIIKFNLGVSVTFEPRGGAGAPLVSSASGGSNRGYPSEPMPPVRESDQEMSFRLITHTLRVHPEHGAGLRLQAEKGGMRIEEIEPEPGQPGLQKMDLIIKINEVSLRGTPDRVEGIFGTHFGDGVVLSVRRVRT
mmetsp:Transcript_91163/g.190644  ORF Transcript_91163/g.190644 Transcript_91163/m.190644 type:complete len:723 (-) Transcript_91163:196-2364(-)|eukprot:CAMPEP_0206434980 /NCGR_PEP_ID=MMETSP0324_2-20121206/9544_1 /ASSEMBLY_ACC=CAM_ASM_000836 /TAXON_ID=2866 /ORGANISM="Crypthecodinium cohnii, Strain Seligo" /LENGTH=722 /DNA_ID=CAMNT_0053901725 /DNA_START=46 /DNA_END=2214 /DNA_ORIENTATION=+